MNSHWRTYSAVKVLFTALAFSCGVAAFSSLTYATPSGEVIFRPQLKLGNKAIHWDKLSENVEACGGVLKKDLKGLPIYHIPVSKLDCTGLIRKSSMGDSFKKLALDVITKARKNVKAKLQSERMGQMNLTLLAKEISEVKVMTSPYGLFESIISAPGTERRHGINLPQLKLVILNEAYDLRKKYEGTKIFSLHEFIEATGLNDHNYASSLLLFELSIDASEILELSPYFDSISRGQTLDVQLAAGTGTLVGGGGDSNEIVFKLSALRGLSQITFPGYQLDRSKLKAAILRSRVSMVNPSSMESYCKSQNLSAESCAGATYDDGEPFMLISSHWIEYAKTGKGHFMIYEVIRGLAAGLDQLR